MNIQKKNNAEQLVPLGELAAYARTKPDYLRYLIFKKKLRGKKVGKIWFSSRQAVDEYRMVVDEAQKPFFDQSTRPVSAVDAWAQSLGLEVSSNDSPSPSLPSGSVFKFLRSKIEFLHSARKSFRMEVKFLPLFSLRSAARMAVAGIVGLCAMVAVATAGRVIMYESRLVASVVVPAIGKTVVDVDTFAQRISDSAVTTFVGVPSFVASSVQKFSDASFLFFQTGSRIGKMSSDFIDHSLAKAHTALGIVDLSGFFKTISGHSQSAVSIF